MLKYTITVEDGDATEWDCTVTLEGFALDSAHLSRIAFDAAAAIHMTDPAEPFVDFTPEPSDAEPQS